MCSYTSGHEQEHQQFWRQVVLWLAHKENQGDESVQLTLDSRRLRLGEQLDFTCEARDKRGEPLQGCELPDRGSQIRKGRNFR